MMEWQPIETAPRDGRDIIVVTVYAEIPTPFVACWSDTFCEWIIGGDCVFGLVVNGAVNIDDTCSINPTHWMPLPEPPK